MYLAAIVAWLERSAAVMGHLKIKQEHNEASVPAGLHTTCEKRRIGYVRDLEVFKYVKGKQQQIVSVLPYLNCCKRLHLSVIYILKCRRRRGGNNLHISVATYA